jgi:enamine deaminase RidA (YjgF/YER057c/UK114 family)
MADIRNLANVPPPVGPYSHVAIVPAGASVVHISGQVASDDNGDLLAKGDFRRQCRAAFENVGRVLSELGLDFQSVVYVRGYLTRPEDVPAYREERAEFYRRAGGELPPPTTTLVVRELYDPECLIEIDALAVLEGD